ncbi:hypothetical protein Tco_0340346 [Tanacetum coccineum]
MVRLQGHLPCSTTLSESPTQEFVNTSHQSPSIGGEASQRRLHPFNGTKLNIGFFTRRCVEALENVIEDEPYFITKIVDNDLRALTMITKHFGRGGGGLVVLGGKSSRESKNGCGEVGGVEKISSTGSKFMANGEDCLDGCDGAGGGEVKGGGVDFGVLKSWSGEIPGETMGERGGDMMDLAVLPVLCATWNRPSVMKGIDFCRPAENILFWSVPI